jgi:transcriptional regulator with XRE-family HTH domain
MTTDERPSFRFHIIGQALRQLRDDARMTLSTAGRLLDRSAGSLSAIETGQQAIRPRDLKHILDVYHLTDQELRTSLMYLAERGRDKDWPRAYEGRISAAARDFASLEADTKRIRSFEMNVIPGLLQTEEYARALIAGGHVTSSGPRNDDELIAFRMARQQTLTKPNPPRFIVVIGEPALRQRVGNEAIMRHQLGRLINVAKLDHVALQILPFSAGALPGNGSPFVIFELLPPGQLTVVVVDDLTRVSFREAHEETAAHADAFDRLRSMALPESESVRFLERIMSEHEES